MKGKLLTVVGIVLIFGYFISESFKNPSDPTQIVMVGGDTLGRDWGAMAEQKLKDATQQNNTAAQEDGLINYDNQYDNGSLIKENENPYSTDKLNSSNYSTIQDANGREVITDYNRPENNIKETPYQSRHQLEKNQLAEPVVVFKE